MSKSVKKQLVFSKELLSRGENKAKSYGISFGEYLRYLVVKDTSMDGQGLLSDDLENSIGVAFEEYKNGEVGELNSREDIDKFVDSLDE